MFFRNTYWFKFIFLGMILMSDVGCRMLDVRCQMFDIECWMSNVGCIRSEVDGQKSKVRTGFIFSLGINEVLQLRLPGFEKFHFNGDKTC